MKTLETTLDDFHKCSATVQQVNWKRCGKLLITRRGEVAERLNAAVC
jgi:hypothetical protein